ncbi:DivIVA domain-containing protein [Streptomyces sp. MAR4 CNX-425]|uniref:DivIVA domain-containing protein n=1 Tax=Streptomyces sp. MAR4 CNX-425 TaxID=3406343 RepID=UPI003B509DE4
MFWFMLIAMVVVVAAVTVVLAGNGEEELTEPRPDRFHDPLPADRPIGRADIDGLRLPVAPRGYRMADVDDALDRVAAELAERDARIAELEAALAGAHAAAYRGGPAGPPEYEDAPPPGPADYRGPGFGGARDLGGLDFGGRSPGGPDPGGRDLGGPGPGGPGPDSGADPRGGLGGRP